MPSRIHLRVSPPDLQASSSRPKAYELIVTVNAISPSKPRRAMRERTLMPAALAGLEAHASSPTAGPVKGANPKPGIPRSIAMQAPVT